MTHGRFDPAGHAVDFHHQRGLEREFGITNLRTTAAQALELDLETGKGTAVELFLAQHRRSDLVAIAVREIRRPVVQDVELEKPRAPPFMLSRTVHDELFDPDVEPKPCAKRVLGIELQRYAGDVGRDEVVVSQGRAKPTFVGHHRKHRVFLDDAERGPEDRRRCHERRQSDQKQSSASHAFTRDFPDTASL